jgi:hypothetical protein
MGVLGLPRRREMEVGDPMEVLGLLRGRERGESENDSRWVDREARTVAGRLLGSVPALCLVMFPYFVVSSMS